MITNFWRKCLDFNYLRQGQMTFVQRSSEYKIDFINNTFWQAKILLIAFDSVLGRVMTLEISNINKMSIFNTPKSMKTYILCPVLSKSIGNKMTIVNDLFCSWIWPFVVVILRFLKKSCMVATVLDKTEYKIWIDTLWRYEI